MMSKDTGVTLCALAAGLVVMCGTAHGASYDNGAFYIEYPDGWTGGQWDDQNGVAFTDNDGGTITVMKHDAYDTVDRHGKRIQLKPGDITGDSLDVVIAGQESSCRTNVYGQCWNYENLGGMVTTAGTKTAILTSYVAKLDGTNIRVHTMIVPDGDTVWVVEARIPKGEPLLAEYTYDDMQRFEPAGAARHAPDPSEIDRLMNLVGDEDASIILERDIRVNLIMIGEEWSRHEISAISRNIPDSYDPLLTIPNHEIGIRYTYDVQFVSEPDPENLANHMLANSFERPVYGAGLFEEPAWLANWVFRNHPEWTHYESVGRHQKLAFDVPYRLVDALAVEKFLYTQYVSPYHDRNGPYTANLVFLKMDMGDAEYLRNHYVSNVDGATGKPTTYTGLMGFGGTYNMMYYDLYAAPWIDYDFDDQDYYIPFHAKSLHDCGDAGCEIDVVSGHVQRALSHVVTPSFLYPIESNPAYALDVLVYALPGGRISVTSGSINGIVDTAAIKKELEYLYPYVEWDVDITVERRDTGGLSYEFKKLFDEQSVETLDTEFGGDVVIRQLDYTKIQPYLVNWTSDRTGIIDGTYTIPVLLLVHDRDKIYLADALGIAPGKEGNDGDPCCALAVVNSDDAWKSGIGPTGLILHEIGHILGLHHPFISFDEYGAAYVDEYYNWYASPMTYSTPVSEWSCGVLWGLLGTERCGNPAPSFTEFERERVSDARLVWLLREMAGDQRNDVAIRGIISSFLAGDTLSERGALNAAMRLYVANR